MMAGTDAMGVRRAALTARTDVLTKETGNTEQRVIKRTDVMAAMIKHPPPDSGFMIVAWNLISGSIIGEVAITVRSTGVLLREGSVISTIPVIGRVSSRAKVRVATVPPVHCLIDTDKIERGEGKTCNGIEVGAPIKKENTLLRKPKAGRFDDLSGFFFRR
jgi:hypothetical protein